MVDSTRALLDELMGKDRNLLPNEKPKSKLHFTDPDVCKFFLCGFCPSELFTNTKSDLGPCYKNHDVSVREEFKRSPDKEKYNYENDFLHHLERLVNDLDRRIKKGLERLEHQNEMPNYPLTEEAREKVDNLTERILSLLKNMEDLAENGKIDESQAIMHQVDQLKLEKDALIRSGTLAAMPTSSSAEKRMRVCETCGAFLVIGDTEKRTISHLEGKQHQGYLKIRTTLEELKKKREDRYGKGGASPPQIGSSSPPADSRDGDDREERGADRGGFRGGRDSGGRRDSGGGRRGYRDDKDGRDDRRRRSRSPVYDRDRGGDRRRGSDRGDRRDRGYSYNDRRRTRDDDD